MRLSNSELLYEVHPKHKKYKNLHHTLNSLLKDKLTLKQRDQACQVVTRNKTKQNINRKF